MVRLRSAATLLVLVVFASAARAATAPGIQLWPPQLQLQMQVPFEPSAFPSAGRICLTYELYLSNFESRPVTIDRVDVLDADDSKPIATFEAQQLNTILHHMGTPIVGDQIPAADDDSHRQLAPGEALVAYVYITLASDSRVPKRLRHRVLADSTAVEGATIFTHHDELHALGPPVEGDHWLAGSGPSNTSHHRRQILVLNGLPHISSRYAIDWTLMENGVSHSGDEQTNSAYYAYGKRVLAVAAGKVVLAKDGIPQNIPGHFGRGSLAVAMSADTLAGNTIALDLGGHQFAHYDHLQPGTLRVKVGDRVRRGQLLALIGNSGSSFEPHLHFEITTSPGTLDGEGLPYLIDQYSVRTPDHRAPERRKRELPLNGTLVHFTMSH